MTTPLVRPPIAPLTARTGETGHRQATWLELFFDLCFVVAVAALARAFHDDPTWDGALVYAGLFVPVWWAWMGWTWFANSFDNDDTLFRGATFGSMLGVVWLATSVGAAAHGDVTAFVLAYVAIRALLLALMVRARMHADKHPDPITHAPVRAFLARYVALNAAALAPWLISLSIDSDARYALWAAGLALELAAPYVAGRVMYSASHGPVGIFHLDHIRERYGLFTIIVLGESILAVSVGVADTGWNAEAMATASLAFLAAVSIWWTYFDRAGRDALGLGQAVAFAWGYGHFAIYAGIAAVGVGTELIVVDAAGGAADAGEHAGPLTTVLAAAAGVDAGGAPGPAIFAGGVAAFLAGMTLINEANLGFRVTSVGRVAMPARLLLAGSLIFLAAALEPAPLTFAAAAGGGMLALNALETVLVRRLQTRLARV